MTNHQQLVSSHANIVLELYRRERISSGQAVELLGIRCMT
jgi:predicted HTH domain antitoxin